MLGFPSPQKSQHKMLQRKIIELSYQYLDYVLNHPIGVNFLAKFLDSFLSRPVGVKFLDNFLSHPIGVNFLSRPVGVKFLDCVLNRSAAEKLIYNKYLPIYLSNNLKYFLSHPILVDGIFEQFIPAQLDRVANLVIELSHMTECYSQEGEDIFLLRLFGPDYKGFYIDVGSHHPERFSNTYLLYKLGWRGINIDATPGSMEKFRIFRPLDINIESAITNDSTPRPFFLFEEGALNTFSDKLAKDYLELGFTLDRHEMVIGRSLASILDENLPAGLEIDVLSVDVEGDEYDVLQSNDWSRYRPHIVLLEVLEVPLAAIAETPQVSLLFQEGYTMVAKFTNTVVFKLEKKN
jgi:hypothetical protein